jgi:hypothetical protein
MIFPFMHRKDNIIFSNTKQIIFFFSKNAFFTDNGYYTPLPESKPSCWQKAST